MLLEDSQLSFVQPAIPVRLQLVERAMSEPILHSVNTSSRNRSVNFSRKRFRPRKRLVFTVPRSAPVIWQISSYVISSV
jgi:hypothetical protein